MVKIKDLKITIEDTMAVNNISFDVGEGEILGMVGESGSGKSQTAFAIAGLLSEDAVMSGEIWFDESCISDLKGRNRREYNGTQISVIFQEPMSSLNPLQKIGQQIEEVLILHAKELSAAERYDKVLRILELVEIDEPAKVYEQYPHELSGGMRQRVVIAIAAILKPRLIIADEPTTSLDSETTKAILSLLLKINKKYNNTIIFISHDLKLVRQICDEVIVMQAGRIVERGSVTDVFENPQKEYTKRLLEAAYLQKKTKGINEIGEENILSVSNVSLYYNDREKGFLGKKYRDYVLDNISFNVKKGEIVGVVGSSGKGKTTLAKAILGMHKEYDGEIICYESRPQMVFQDPFDSLDPSMKIGDIVAEPLRVNRIANKDNTCMKKADIKDTVVHMLEKVGLSKEFYDRYPNELSGGQRQRVSIAMALIGGSKFIVADEPCSALDVTVAKQIMELLLSLKRDMEVAVLLISHDEDLINAMCDRVIEL